MVASSTTSLTTATTGQYVRGGVDGLMEGVYDYFFTPAPKIGSSTVAESDIAINPYNRNSNNEDDDYYDHDRRHHNRHGRDRHNRRRYHDDEGDERDDGEGYGHGDWVGTTATKHKQNRGGGGNDDGYYDYDYDQNEEDQILFRADDDRRAQQQKQHAVVDPPVDEEYDGHLYGQQGNQQLQEEHTDRRRRSRGGSRRSHQRRRQHQVYDEDAHNELDDLMSMEVSIKPRRADSTSAERRVVDTTPPTNIDTSRTSRSPFAGLHQEIVSRVESLRKDVGEATNDWSPFLSESKPEATHSSTSRHSLQTDTNDTKGTKNGLPDRSSFAALGDELLRSFSKRQSQQESPVGKSNGTAAKPKKTESSLASSSIAAGSDPFIMELKNKLKKVSERHEAGIPWVPQHETNKSDSKNVMSDTSEGATQNSERTPPIRYTLSHVKRASTTETPPKHDEFVSELKQWHNRHELRTTSAGTELHKTSDIIFKSRNAQSFADDLESYGGEESTTINTELPSGTDGRQLGDTTLSPSPASDPSSSKRAPDAKSKEGVKKGRRSWKLFGLLRRTSSSAKQRGIATIEEDKERPKPDEKHTKTVDKSTNPPVPKEAVETSGSKKAEQKPRTSTSSGHQKDVVEGNDKMHVSNVISPNEKKSTPESVVGSKTKSGALSVVKSLTKSLTKSNTSKENEISKVSKSDRSPVDYVIFENPANHEPKNQSKSQEQNKNLTLTSNPSLPQVAKDGVVENRTNNNNSNSKPQRISGGGTGGRRQDRRQSSSKRTSTLLLTDGEMMNIVNDPMTIRETIKLQKRKRRAERKAKLSQSLF